MDAVLNLKSICKSFSGVQVLKGVNFTLAKGEIHGLMGENGAGKSTLIKVIGGIYAKDSGQIEVNGSPVSIKSPDDSMDLGIQIIHQEFSLVPKLTVAENMFLGQYPIKNGFVDWKKMNEAATEVLERIGEKIPPTRIISDLTVAEQQIVEIAKAVNKNPSVLIMDEPTAALNDQETEHLFKIVRTMRDKGVSIVIITHRISEQFALSDRITVLRDGSTIGTVNTKEITSDELISMMVGRVITDMYKRNRRQPGKTVLQAKSISVPNKVHNVNFEVKEGEIVSIFGLMGMGQKELCNSLVGNAKKVLGEIQLYGHPVRLTSPQKAREAGIGHVSDDRRTEGIIPVMSVKENTSITILKRLSGLLGFIHRGKETEEVLRWTKKLNVKCSSLSQQIRYLSGGNQQKVLINRWLINDTKLFILNMPTRGIDVGAKSEIYHLLDQLCSQGAAILLFSYEMPEVLGISDRVYVLCDGTISGEYTFDEATQEKLMESAISKYIA